MANRFFSPGPIVGAVIALLFTVLSLVRPFPLAGLEQGLLDLVQRVSSFDAPASGRVVLVEIDRESLNRLGAWPWPRQRIAGLVDRLDRAGARHIGLLLPLLDEARGNGHEAVRDLIEELNAHPLSSHHQELAQWVRDNLLETARALDQDGRLVESVRRTGKVVLPVDARFDGGAGKPSGKAVQLLAGSLLGPADLTEASKRRVSASDLSLPFDALARAAAGFGHASLTPKNVRDGRSHGLWVRYRGALIPSMPLRLALAHLGRAPGTVSPRNGEIRLASGVLQVVDGGMLLRFVSGPPPFEVLSPADVLEGKKLNRAKNRIALVALGRDVGRTFRTPVDASMPEGRLAARTLEALIQGRCVTRPGAFLVLEPLMVLALGLAALLLCTRPGVGTGIALAAGLCAVALGTEFAVYALAGAWLQTGTAVLCILTVSAAALLQRVLLAPSASKEAIETNRLLGLSFQSQGLLDLAFDKFKKLPLDDESRDLMYNLGLEFEQKRMINKALDVYEHINRTGGYRDLADRIPRLREADSASTLGSHAAAKGSRVLAEAGEEGRSRVGRFEILGELGKGSMGLVYKARDPKINRLLAIKTIRFSDEFEEDVIQEIKERFFTEAEIAGQLSHPSIVTIYDVGDDGDLTYMAMEFLEGKDLDNFISKKGLLSLPKVLDVVSRVADALAFAHQASVIHRDIKPANIMLLDSGGVKVTDFGIAKAISSSRTRTGVILGTPNYMSPEQIMGQKIDHRSDIFSLGVLFYQLLTGELPFRGENLSNLLYQITQVRHPSPREINPRIPKACEQLIDRALTKNPADRFQSAAEMAKLLKLLLSKIERLRKQPAQRKPQPKAQGVPIHEPDFGHRSVSNPDRQALNRGDALDIQAAGLTDVGLKREGNEDAFSTDEASRLFIVADGMGGHLAGEVASSIAVEMINNSFRRWLQNEASLDDLYGTADGSLSLLGNYLSSSIRLANRVVYEMAREYDQYHGMGTTVAAIHVTPSLIVAANAGDSRIYLVRGRELERLSKDHTIVSEQVDLGMMTPEEAETSPLKHVLTRNLGSSEALDVEVYEIEPSEEDRFVLCSDGLTDLVSDEEILETTQAHDDPEALCKTFVKTALQRGGHDNTTVVSVFVKGAPKSKDPPLKKLSRVLADVVIGIQKMMKKIKP